jgi:hypothetical protein
VFVEAAPVVDDPPRARGHAPAPVAQKSRAGRAPVGQKSTKRKRETGDCDGSVNPTPIPTGVLRRCGGVFPLRAGRTRNGAVRSDGAGFAPKRGILNGKLNEAPFGVRLKVSRGTAPPERITTWLYDCDTSRFPKQPLSPSVNRRKQRASVAFAPACVRLIIPFLLYV